MCGTCEDGEVHIDLEFGPVTTSPAAAPLLQGAPAFRFTREDQDGEGIRKIMQSGTKIGKAVTEPRTRSAQKKLKILLQTGDPGPFSVHMWLVGDMRAHGVKRVRYHRTRAAPAAAPRGGSGRGGGAWTVSAVTSKCTCHHTKPKPFLRFV